MNTWTRVIVEWANCLGVVDSDIESIEDLRDGAFYEKLIYQLCKGNENYTDKITISEDEPELVSKFIQSEYPEFGSVECTTSVPEELYVASLLLVQCSQQPMFHRPMCVALKHETQVRIKHFLEMVLPCGKNLTKESIVSAIAELADFATSEEASTPVARPLREFFNSPAVRSAQSQRFMNDRNRELMCLRAQLETEQFEKADLMEDLKTQNEKICNLQKKLDEKARELRELRMSRIEASTPQSCRKTKRSSDNEERYRREADHLQTLNLELQSEIEKLREESEELSRRLVSSEKFNLAIREKCEQTESNVENILRRLEAKNSEVSELRASNEELREQIRQSKRISIGEPSFYVETLCDEAMSSVVDIQLQEARKESAELKLDLTALREKYENSVSECQQLRRLEDTLREKTTELESLASKLRDAERRLAASDAKAAALESEKSKLCDVLEKLGSCVQEKDELLNLAEKRSEERKSQLELLDSKLRETEASLSSEKHLSSELRSKFEDVEREAKSLRNALSSAEEKLSLVRSEERELRLEFDKSSAELRESLVFLENERSTVARLETTLEQCNRESESLKKRVAAAEKETVLSNDTKKLVEMNFEMKVHQLMDTQIHLTEEVSRNRELRAKLRDATDEINVWKDSVRSNQQLLNSERVKVTELKRKVLECKNDYDHSQSELRDTRVTLEAEKEASSELREVLSRSEKKSEELEALLAAKEQLLRESKDRESSLEEETKSRESRIEELNEALKIEVSRREELAGEFSRAKDAITELEAKLMATEEVSRETEISRTKIETELREAQAKIEKIRSDLEATESKLTSVEEEKRRAILANEKLEEYAKVADEKIVNVEVRIFEYERRIRDLDESLTERIEKCNKLQNELNEKNIAVSSLSERLREEETRGVAMAESAAAREKRISELEEHRKEMENRMARERENLTILRTDNENLAEKLSVCVSSRSELEKVMDGVKEELETTREHLRKESAANEELRSIVEDSSNAKNQLNEQLTRVRNRLTEVLSERDGLKEQVDSYVNETSIMKQGIEKMEQQLAESNENIAEKVSMMEELKMKNEDMRRKHNELEEKLIMEKNQFTIVVGERDGLKEQLDSNVNEMTILRQRIEKMEQQLAESNENIAEKASMMEELKMKNEDMRRKHIELEEKLIMEKNQFTNMVGERDGLKEQLDSNVNEMTILRQRIEKMEQQLAESNENIAEKASMMEELKMKNEDMRRKHIELEEKLIMEKNQFTNMVGERDGLKEQLDSNVNEMTILRQRIEKMEQQLAESNKNIAEKASTIEELKIKNEDMRTKQKELEEKLLQEKDQFTIVLSERDSLREELAFHESEASIMRERIEKMEQQLAESNKNIAEKASMMEELKIKNEDMRRKHNELEEKLIMEKNQFTNMVGERDGMKEQLDSHVNEMTVMRERIEKMEQQLAESNENIAEKASIIEELEIKNEDMRRKHNELEEKLLQEKNQFTILLSERDSLREELASHVNEASIMRERIEKTERELEKSHESLAEKASIIEELKIKNEDMRRKHNELEEKLLQEKNQFTVVLSERDNLREELASQVSEASIMRERIEKTERQLAESNENVEEKASAIEELKIKNEDMRTKQKELEEKLLQEKNQFTVVLSERDSLREELASQVSEASIMRERIEKTERELEKSHESVAEKASIIEELKIKNEDARTKHDELKEKLLQKKNQFTIVLSERDSLREELASHASEASLMKDRIEKMEKNLSESNEELEKEVSTSEKLRKELESLRTINNDLQDELEEAREQYKIILSERTAIEKEIEKYAEKTSSLEQHLDNVRMELNEIARDIRKYAEENKDLAKRESELSESEKKLKDQLAEARKTLHDLQTEKGQLERELSSFVGAKTDMIEEISALHKELESSRNEHQNVRATSEKERATLRQRIAELGEESKLRAEETRSLRDELEAARLEKQRLAEKIDVAGSTVVSLEKRLVVAENAREESRLEDKLKEEALGVVRGKLEQLAKEKIETELRMKEVITNLQEVRTSQDQVLAAQVKAIEEKTRRLELLEKESSETESSLVEKTRELEREKTRVKSLTEEFGRLREKSERDATLVEELREDLERERRRILEESLVSESLRERMTEIDQVSKTLKVELSALWESIREACPELARPRDDETPGSESNAESIVASFVDDAKAIRKAVSILGEANETLKERLDREKETAMEMSREVEKRKIELDERLNSIESELGQRDEYLRGLVKRKKDLQGLLSTAIAERDEVDDRLVRSTEKWKSLDADARSYLKTGSSECKELERLKVKRDEVENCLLTFNERHARSSRDLLKALCRIFLWSETKLQEACEASSRPIKEEFSPETALSEEMERDRVMRKDLESVDERIEEFSDLLENHESKFKAGLIKLSSSNEDKLQAQLDKLTKERKELKEKLDAARVRNAKMEKNMDELRSCNKKLKTEVTEAIRDEERAELERLRELNEKLEATNADLLRKISDNAEIESRLETVHGEYGQKLEKIKQKMKTAYNEQIAKLNQEQEKILKEKMETLKAQTEQQCRKYTEDIAKYKAHITDLSSRYWDVGEKLLAETQEKQAAVQQLQRLKEQRQQEAIADVSEKTTQNRQKTASLDRREFSIDRAARDSTARTAFRAVEVIEEETTTFSTRRHSVKSIQAMGNAFKAEDEEGELFDSVYLADLKEGRCAPSAPDFDRISELRIRNSMCRPHLKSSYAVETNLQPVALNEDDIKNGVVGDDVFNDSLSQSLLPGQKPKRKDRTQTSYKRPGPPTPSKNGGRLSLQGNEAKSPSGRILKERNVERRTTATPRGLKNLFGASMSKRQDENTAGTPKGRRLSSIFRKQRVERN